MIIIVVLKQNYTIMTVTESKDKDKLVTEESERRDDSKIVKILEKQLSKVLSQLSRSEDNQSKLKVNLRKAKAENTRLRSIISAKQEKGKSRTRELRSAKQQITRLTSKVMRTERASSKRRQNNEKAPNHTYSLGIIRFALMLCLQTSSSLRGVSAAVQQALELTGESPRLISHNTIRYWVMRFGLSSYNSKIGAGKYAMIIDESISIGENRMFVALVVPIKDNENLKEAIHLKDVSILELGVSKSWKGSEIAKVLKNGLSRNVGVEIAYCISDNGGNLKLAQKELKLRMVRDCTHEMANLLMSIYGNDVDFEELLKIIGKLRQYWKVGKNAAYLPPNLRVRGRYNQIFKLVDWAYSMKKIYESMPKDVQEAFSFLEEKKSLLSTLKVIKELLSKLSKLLKKEGIKSETKTKWEEIYVEVLKEHLSADAKMTPIEVFKNAMDQYIDEYSVHVMDGGQILCTSDIIESLFGKYKNKGGMALITDDVLRIPGFCSSITVENILEKLNNCKTIDLLSWKKENIPDSPLKIRRDLMRKSAS